MPSTPKPSASRQARVAKPAGGAARRQPSRGSGRPPGKAPTKPAGRGGRRAASRSAELALLGALRRGLYVVVLLSVGLVGGGEVERGGSVGGENRVNVKLSEM